MKSKIPKRTYTMGIRLKDDEYKFIKGEADKRLLRVSDYVRDVLLFKMDFRTPSVK
jgi:hypothetical protein